MLLTIVVVAAMAAALVVWAVPLARSGVGSQQDANLNASHADIHDDAWNMPRNAGAGSAIVHDDAWNMQRSADVHPSWVNLRDDEGNVHRVRVH